MNLRFLLLAFFTTISISVWSQNNIESVVNDFLMKPEYKSATVGIDVVNINSRETLYELNPNKLLIPASTVKLITSAAAIEILGADYRFETKLGYTGRKEKNSTLSGNLVVIGGGDPALGSEFFKEHYYQFLENWARKIKEAGIHRIEGDLILDGSIYDSEKVPTTWIWEDIGNYYGAGANAFTIYDNLFRITFKSPRKAGKATSIISTYPKIEGLSISNNVISANSNRDQAYVFGSPLDKTRTIRGTIPKNRSAFTIKAAIHQPEEVLANELKKALAKEGIFMTGDVRFEPSNKKDVKIIYIQESPTLKEITKVLNYKSINLFAEHLIRQIAAEKNGLGNRNAGIEIIKNYWQENGCNANSVFMEDGSGLSHFNAMSPRFFTNILTFMSNNEPFKESLPSAGKGTLSSFSSELFPHKTLIAKSGSMTRIRCYAGYLNTQNGNTIAFSIMVNHFSGNHSTLINEIEQILKVISKFQPGVD